jgi:hypothetical protein
MAGKALKNASATRMAASIIGVGIIGVGGFEHGFLEVLQGNVAPSGVVIDAVGPAQRFWPGASEPAFSLVPNMLVTGICAMIVSLLIAVWAGAFIDRKCSALVLPLLSTILFLVGGGGGPIVIALIACIPTAHIDKPLVWWRKRLPPRVQGFLARLWPWSLIVALLLFCSAVEIAVFGMPFSWFLSTDVTLVILSIVGNISTMLLPVAILAAFAHEIQKQPDSTQASCTQGRHGQ